MVALNEKPINEWINRNVITQPQADTILTDLKENKKENTSNKLSLSLLPKMYLPWVYA